MTCKKGLSLIEIMTALFVLSFAILSVASIFPAGLEMNRKTKIRIEALETAAGVLQNIKDLPYHDPYTSGSDFYSLLTGTGTINLDLQHFVWGSHNYPEAVLDENDEFKYGDLESSIFFRDSSGDDTRVGGGAPTEPQLPAICLEPLLPGSTPGTNPYMYSYVAGTNRCRFYRITVTVNIEDIRKGEFFYSYIQVISYRGDSLTLTPGQ